MIASWMLYCLAVGALLTLGALAMERGMRAARLPQRWVWAAAIVLGVAIPAGARWLPRATAPIPVPSSAGPVETIRFRLSDLPVDAAETLGFDTASLDRPLAIGWMTTSATAVVALLGAGLVLAHRRRRWTMAEVEGVPVLVSVNTGPAVIGLIRGRIVLPAWVLDADPAERALLVEHEREHVRAGDPRLLALGLLAVALMPWNPLAWINLRRLRLAIEIDCDARVLARRADVRAYGTLLLNVGRRASSSSLLAAAAFSEPTSFLERRIRIMTAPPIRRPWLRAAGFGVASLALLAAACQAPGPARTRPTVAAGTEPVHTTVTTTTEARPSAARGDHGAIQAAVREHYPEVLRAAPTESASLLFVVDANGVVRHTERVRLPRTDRSPEAMVETLTRARGLVDARNAADAVIDVVAFSAGMVGPGAVDVVWARELRADQRVTTTVVDTARVSGPVAVARVGELARAQAAVARTVAGEAVPVKAAVTTTVPTEAVRGRAAVTTTVATEAVRGQATVARTIPAEAVRGRAAVATTVATEPVRGQPTVARTIPAEAVRGEATVARTTPSGAVRGQATVAPTQP